MKTALEFHDSIVSDTSAVGPNLVVTFSEAYIHRSTGEPGVSAGDGFMQPAELIFSGASWSGALHEARGAISDAYILVADQQLTLLPIPFIATSVVAAEFSFVSGSVLKVTATSASCSVAGTARWVERYAG